MNKKALIALCAILPLMINSCGKVARVDISLSPDKITVGPSGAEVLIKSKTSEYSWDAIRILQEDGTWKEDPSNDRKGDVLTFEWLSARKVKEDDGTMSMMLTIAPNDSGDTRQAKVSVMAGDSMDRVTITQLP